jgi:hypothetical protein
VSPLGFCYSPLMSLPEAIPAPDNGRSEGAQPSPSCNAGRSLRYHLRFQVIPGARTAKAAADLAAFCVRHRVEEVVLFYNAEEWNTGHPDAKEEDAWLATVQEVKQHLREEGVRVSLNPWITVLHTDRGRRLKKGQNFTPMVSPAGETAVAVASFADPAWRVYIARQWARFAALGFRLIWVEDDFRWHNHAPLTWGGGFEQPVLDRFARKIGRPVTREEVVKNILAPGDPHPWRRPWMDTWREIQLETAGLLARAVREGSGGATGLGLMSSLPSVHGIEGRDWGLLFKALAETEQPPAHRPHFAPYGDAPGKSHAYPMTMLDLQRTLRDPSMETAPEIENFPFTHWNKSDAQTWAEMAIALFQGSDALLLDLFPFLGNSTKAEPAVGKLLDAGRPGLEWITARFGKDLETQGVGTPWKQDAEAFVRTARGVSLTELDATSLSPGRFLLPFGVPATARPGQPVNAVFGSLAWAFTDAELRGLLSGGLLLDGESAAILNERGFADLIGVDVKGRRDRDHADFAVETAVDPECGATRGLHFSVNNAPWISVLAPLPGAHAWTKITTPERTMVGAGITVFTNTLGGRVAALAVPDPALLAQSDQRRTIVHRIVDFLWAGTAPLGCAASSDAPGRAPLLVDGGPHLLPMHFKTPDGKREIAVVMNGSVDPTRISMRFAGGGAGAAAAGEIRATLLAPLSSPREIPVTRKTTKEGNLLVTGRRSVPYFGFMVMELGT